MCADNRNGECPMHGPLHSLRRLVGTSSTAAPVTLPDIPDWLRDLPREVTPTSYMQPLTKTVWFRASKIPLSSLIFEWFIIYLKILKFNVVPAKLYLIVII